MRGREEKRGRDPEFREKSGDVKAPKTNFADLTMTRPIPETIMSDDINQEQRQSTIDVVSLVIFAKEI